MAEIIIPSTAQELGKLLRLEAYTVRYIEKNFETPQAAINKVRHYTISEPLPRDINKSLFDLYEQALKKGYIFQDYPFGAALRSLAAELEPYAHLTIELPYSKLLRGDVLDDEAYASLSPLPSQQIKRAMEVILSVCDNPRRATQVGRFLGILPNERLMKCYGKTGYGIDSTAHKYANEAMEKLKQPIYANKIVYLALSDSEARFLRRQLADGDFNDDHSKTMDSTLIEVIASLGPMKRRRVSIDGLAEKGLISCDVRNALRYAEYEYGEELADLSYADFCRIRNICVSDRKNIIHAIEDAGIIFADALFYIE